MAVLCHYREEDVRGALPGEELGWEGRASVMTEHSTWITEGTGEEQQHEVSLKMCMALALLSCKQNLSVLTVG